MPGRLRSAAVLLLSLGCCLAQAAASDDRTDATAGGRLVWVVADELDILGDIWVDLPFGLGSADGFFLGVDTRLTMEKPNSDFAFQVRNLQYDIDLGWRGRPAALGGRELSLFVGQQGNERADADGQAYVRFAGLGLSSRWFHIHDPEARARFDWYVAAAPLLAEREVSGSLLLRGQARLVLPGSRLPRFDLDVRFDGLVDDGKLFGEIAGGPRVWLPAGPGRRVSLFVRYLQSRDPLKLDIDAWLAGVSYEEGSGAGPSSLAPPEIDGSLLAGGGEGRWGTRLSLRLLSPEFGRRTRVVFEVDANLLTAEDTGELYYRYELGVQQARRGYLRGVYFHHRSNHRLAEPGDEITAINVVELGFESESWSRPGRRDRAAGGKRLELHARAGYLHTSSYGEQDRWHLRTGARVTFTAIDRPGPQPFFLGSAEAGDVERVLLALGLALSPNWDVRVEYRDDDQYFSRDRTATLLTAIYGF